MKEPITNSIEYENRLLDSGYATLAGMDEVGRGCLAGPVTVACVSLPLDKDNIIRGIRDSKKLSPTKRSKLYEIILQKATSVAVISIDNEVIDKINILNATKQAMNRCIDKIDADCVMIDAVELPNASKTTFSLISGDNISYLIAAASIVAKVTRDKMMTEYAEEFPVYGFEQNKGYGTGNHIAAIKKYGLCRLHRRTFVKNFCEE